MPMTTQLNSSEGLPASSQGHQPRRGWLLNVWRRLKWLGTGLIALIVLGMAYQTIATEMDQRNYPPPGQLVDVGGYSLHLYCIGENIDGRATVILETGLGGFATSSDWARVQPEIAKTTRVCAYDRAGLGWSGPGPQPRDAQHIATELHTLLQNSHTPGPYILVGWSFGGLYTRVYVDLYREDVAGLVLLESSSPEQCTSTPAWQAQCASNARNAFMAHVLAPFGVMRMIGLLQPATGLPDPQNRALFASFSAAKDWDAQNAEFQSSSATNTQVLNSKALGAIPLFVLTATEHGATPELEQQWQVWQSGYTALSTNGVQQVVTGATHDSLIFSSKDARVTIKAILQVIEAARTGEPLIK
jgi:pimeloyl-ACP methyl ester carboxylesterase